MREETGQPGQQLEGRDGSAWSTTSDYHRKNIESWVGTNNLIFCSTYNAHALFFLNVFGVEGAWLSPNTLLTMVNDFKPTHNFSNRHFSLRVNMILTSSHFPHIFSRDFRM